MTTKRSVANDLRKVIRGRGLSAYAISKATGVGQPLISRFLRGKDMGIERASIIAAYLGLTLEPQFTTDVVKDIKPAVKKIRLKIKTTGPRKRAR
jgi:transcriptional regulator with XRE-family HTH domain